MIKLALERGKKESERDCIKKMTEANQMAETLGIMKSYSAYLDENEGLVCKVYDKFTREVSELNLKKFLFEPECPKAILAIHNYWQVILDFLLLVREVIGLRLACCHLVTDRTCSDLRIASVF